MLEHTFLVGKHLPAEKWRQEGKPDCANYIVMKMDHDHAWRIIESMLAQIRRSEGQETDIELSLLGELSVYTEDENTEKQGG